jgi:hypothetical protein
MASMKVALFDEHTHILTLLVKDTLFACDQNLHSIFLQTIDVGCASVHLVTGTFG